MRFLIVDESSAVRNQLAIMLRANWPLAETEQWSPRERGHPREAISRGSYSAVLLDTHPAGADGIQWAAEIRQDPESPPILLVSNEGGEDLAIRAMKAGASDFLLKSELTAERLTRSLQEALREHEARRIDRSGPNSVFMRTVRLDVRKIGAPVQHQDSPVPGYRALRMIGAGGMAKVYLAEREHDDMQLVLKLLDSDLRRDDTFLKRFVREYKLIASIENEHVARIYDQGFAGEQPYIAMEYLSGGTLGARIQEGMTSLAALRLTSQIARALDAIHAHGIAHRDLKPANIMFRDNGRPVIVDFGLARDLGVESELTRHGEVMATPRYMSPEQCMGKPADHRSDLYSVGAIFYEMLTGHKLFGNENPAGLMYLHVNGEIPRLPGRLAGYQTILDRLLAKKPVDRFQSARELFATIAV